MKLQSWNRFNTRALAVEPGLMGSATSFIHEEIRVREEYPLILATIFLWPGFSMREEIYG